MRIGYYIVSSVLIIVAFVLGQYYQKLIQPSPRNATIVQDTVYIEKFVDKPVVKYVYKDKLKVDTLYIAQLDTTIKDVRVKVDYSSELEIPQGQYSVSVVTPPPFYPSVYLRYGFRYQPEITHNIAIGKYLYNSKHIKIGAGLFGVKEPARWVVGGEVSVLVEY